MFQLEDERKKILLAVNTAQRGGSAIQVERQDHLIDGKLSLDLEIY